MSHLYAQYPAKPHTPIESACPVKPAVRPNVSTTINETEENGGNGGGQRTVEEVAFLDAEMAYAGDEAKDGETNDVGEERHGDGGGGVWWRSLWTCGRRC